MLKEIRTSEDGRYSEYVVEVEGEIIDVIMITNEGNVEVKYVTK